MKLGELIKTNLLSVPFYNRTQELLLKIPALL